jgi:hypothetical protein
VLVVGPTAFADITDERINAATAETTRPKRFTGLFPPFVVASRLPARIYCGQAGGANTRERIADALTSDVLNI